MLHYPNLSSGYIGVKEDKAAITSRYFSIILNDNTLLEERLIFPQRIPRIDFFYELMRLEDRSFKKEFDAVKTKLKNRIKTLINTQNKTDSQVINYLNLLLRFGGFSDVLTLLEAFKKHEGSNQLEILFIKEIAKIEIDLSHDALPNLLSLKNLCDEVLENLSDKKYLNLALRILNRLTVYHFRNGSNLGNQDVNQYMYILLDEVKKIIPVHFSDYILKSVVYRGLAMHHISGEKTQGEALKQAEILARNAKYQSELEKIIYQDNLLTCLQTLSKWNYLMGDIDMAESNLEEMMHIDPHDSVVFSEMGIFLMKQSRYMDAVTYFNRAVVLGPPGKGMNLFLQAKCYEKLNAMNEYVECLNQCTLADEKALSPLLDLFYFYKATNSTMEYKEFSRKILFNPELKAQLKSDERLILEENL